MATANVPAKKVAKKAPAKKAAPRPGTPTPRQPLNLPGDPISASPTGPSGPRPAAGVPTAGATPSADRSAIRDLRLFLDTYGLADLAEGAWQQFLATNDLVAVLDWVKGTQTYKTRFSGLAELAAKGRAIDEQEYINLERAYAQRLRIYGMPESMSVDRGLLGRLIGNDVSPEELDRRLGYYQRVVSQAVPAETRAYMQTHFGITDGDLMSFWLNPDEAEVELERKTKAASIGGAVARSGWGDLDTDRALRYADLGLDEARVAGAFGEAGHLKELQSQLPGDPGGTTIGAFSVQDALLEGNYAARDQVERSQRRRQAQFEGGGQVAAGRGGIAGLGSAAT